MGAIDPGSWHDWHLAWKIGATSLENVTFRSAARAMTGAAITVATTIAGTLQRPNPAICGSFSKESCPGRHAGSGQIHPANSSRPGRRVRGYSALVLREDRPFAGL